MLSRLRSLHRLTSLSQVRTLASVASKSNVSASSSSLVEQLQLQKNDGLLQVHWKDNKTDSYPFVYLRDICQCAKCFDHGSLQRGRDTLGDLQSDSIEPKKVEVSQDGERVFISWPDEHVTELESKWLRSKRLPEREELHGKIKLNAKGVEFWDRQTSQGKIRHFDFEQVLNDDGTLYDWLYSLHSHGLAFMHNVPEHRDPISCTRLAKRVGYIKSTHYGHTFDVYSKFDANNLAYTTDALPLHCDIPQSEYYPGVQFLHCLQQCPTEGGGNIFVDGFHIAQELKEKHPKLFHLLSITSIPYVDIGKDVFGDFHLANSRPVVQLNEFGHIVRFTYNNHVRDYHMNTTPEVTQQIYQGYLMLGRMMRDPLNMIEHKLSEGEMVTFNNSRVLHGRQAFQITGTGNRHLEGCYLDWDLVYGRLRSLATSLGKPFYN